MLAVLDGVGVGLDFAGVDRRDIQAGDGEGAVGLDGPVITLASSGTQESHTAVVTTR